MAYKTLQEKNVEETIVTSKKPQIKVTVPIHRQEKKKAKIVFDDDFTPSTASSGKKKKMPIAK